MLSTIHLLLAIIAHFTQQGKIQLDLPRMAKVRVIKVKKNGKNLEKEILTENLIRSESARIEYVHKILISVLRRIKRYKSPFP